MFVGFENYVERLHQARPQADGLLAGAAADRASGRPSTSPSTSLGGMGLALLLHRKMRGKGIYRALIVLPWAMPQIVALAVWRTEYQLRVRRRQPAARAWSASPPNWLSDPFWNFVGHDHHERLAGHPVHDGDHARRPPEHLAATTTRPPEIDGANGRQSFRHITLPLLRPVLTPAIILGTVWTFNNINVPFFINQNELETSDILVTGALPRGLPVQPLRFRGRVRVRRSSCSCSPSPSSTSGPAAA